MAAAPATGGSSGLLSASAFMAAGTVVSRLTGFVRTALIAAAIGKALNADLFNNANTIPNSLYILVAGGVFNVVLVPQLIRSMRNDSDGGQAYGNRVLTLGLLVLVGATAVLMALVPLLMHVAYQDNLFNPHLTVPRESAQRLMLYCLPQVFFYGIFVLLGQILNARQRFGPMMWAPIVNNVISCTVLAFYIGAYGTSNGAGGFGTGEELLLGIGSTVGIAAQTAVLVPYLRVAGFRPRLRFDFRGVGLGHTLRLGAWTVGFVISTQVAFFVVNRIASGSSAAAALGHGQASGSTVYQWAFLITQVPHGIITVSIVTATMPMLSRLAAEQRIGAMRREVVSTLRTVLAAVTPTAVAVACLGQPIATVLFSHGGAAGHTSVIGAATIAFAPGLLLFTVYYLLLRAFYALEDTRTPFLIQVVLSLVNVVAAVILTTGSPIDQVATWLAIAYGIAYLVGVTIATTALSRRLGTLVDAEFVRFVVRLALASAVAAAVMLLAAHVLEDAGFSAARVLSGAVVVVAAGLAGLLAYLAAARAMRMDELGSLVRAVSRRG
ncbi:MAG: murein biosynthesis integral membrane protein MurJ [Nocardioidaceae bacterium]